MMKMHTGKLTMTYVAVGMMVWAATPAFATVGDLAVLSIDPNVIESTQQAVNVDVTFEWRETHDPLFNPGLPNFWIGYVAVITVGSNSFQFFYTWEEFGGPLRSYTSGGASDLYTMTHTIPLDGSAALGCYDLTVHVSEIVEGNLETGEVVSSGFDQSVTIPSAICIVPALVAIDVHPEAIQLPKGKSQGQGAAASGVVQVTIYSSGSFNATEVDVSTVELGDPTLPGTVAPIGYQLSGGNLVVRFNRQQMVNNNAIDEDTVELLLTGQTFGGVSFEGTDSVKIVP